LLYGKGVRGLPPADMVVEASDFLPAVERPSNAAWRQRVPRAAAQLQRRLCTGEKDGPRMASAASVSLRSSSSSKVVQESSWLGDSVSSWYRGVRASLGEMAELRAKQTQELTPEAVLATLSGIGDCIPVVRCKPTFVLSTDGADTSREARQCSVWWTPSERIQEVIARGSFAVAKGWSALPTLSPEGTARTAGLCASWLTPLAAVGIAHSNPDVMVAFCPVDFGMEGLKGMSLDPTAALQELSLEELQQGVLVSTFLQGSLGIARVCLGDVFSGTYQLLLATLGFNARHPGPSSNWLKTYVLITFINGTMSAIDLVQNMLLQNYPTVALALPLSVNAAHMVTLMVPPVSFVGAYCGWQHIKMQRKLANEAAMAQQAQLMALLQQFPPPPLFGPMQGQFQAAAIDAPWGFNPAQLPAPPQRAVQEEQQASDGGAAS